MRTYGPAVPPTAWIVRSYRRGRYVFPYDFLSRLRPGMPQVRKFVNDQYVEAGLNLHACWSPVEVKKQADGKLTLVVKHKDGTTKELPDNDQVGVLGKRYVVLTPARCPACAVHVCCRPPQLLSPSATHGNMGAGLHGYWAAA